jgi:hypothetical protein
MSLTDMQFKLMNHIAHCEMNTINGATPKTADDVNTYLWVDGWATSLGYTEYQIGGCLSSLTVAGLVWVTPKSRSDPDGGVGFTAAGFEAWNLEFNQRAMEVEA